MSGLPYTGGMNSYMFDMSQYGVNMPQNNTGQVLQATSGLASLIPYIGPLLGAGMNLAGTYMQNQQQEYFYNQYMSPQARMRQMVAAGINPNAAAQGISGSSVPNLTAASPTSAFSALGEQLGQSANTALTANVLRSEAVKNQSEAQLNDSLNTEKTITNSYLDKQQQATLDKLIADGHISQSTANMLAVDESYKPGVAAVSYGMLINQFAQSALEVDKLVSAITLDYADAYAAMMAGDLSEAQIHKVFSDIGLNNAMIERISHEIENIDAETLATYQGMTESRARTWLTNVQAGYAQKYLDIFKNTGWDYQSDINKNFFGFIAQGQEDNAKALLDDLKIYLKAEGDGKALGKDFKIEQMFDAVRTGAMILGGAGMYLGATKAKASAPAFRPKPERRQIFPKSTKRVNRPYHETYVGPDPVD